MTKSQVFKHGVGGYNNRGCRCDICRTAKLEYGRAYYRKNREVINRRSRDWLVNRLATDPAFVERYRARHRGYDRQRSPRQRRRAEYFREYRRRRADITPMTVRSEER